MAQPQQNINLRAPGFAGLNTQDSPIELPVAFASQADNCVLDKSGRIAARKGFQQVTTNPDILLDGGEPQPIKAIAEFITEDGQSIIFACGNKQIFIQELSGSLELVPQVLPIVPTDDNWEIVPFNNQCFFVQAGNPPLVYDAVTGLFTEVVPTGDGAAWAFGYPNCCTAAFGHMWYGDFDDDKSVMFFSVFLEGANVPGTANSFDLREFWPFGFDEMEAIRQWNNYLVVFGQRSILFYTIDPAGPGSTGTVLVDAIEGIGCIARDSVVPLGDRIWFLDATGVRDLGRTIQEKSVPIGDISYNVRSDFKEAIAFEREPDIKAFYDAEASIYAIFLPNNPKTYVFDTRQMMEGGKARVTQWTGISPRCGTRTLRARTSYAGGNYGVYRYTGFEDKGRDTNASPVEIIPIEVAYYTHPLVFGEPSTVKFPKQVDVTIIGGQETTLNLDWAYDYTNVYKSSPKTVSGGGTPGWYDLNEPAIPDPEAQTQYNENGEYGRGVGVQRLKYNIWGSGNNIKIGFRAQTKDAPFSFQEINIQALMGRIL